MGYAFASILKNPLRMGFYSIFIKILPEWGLNVVLFQRMLSFDTFSVFGFVNTFSIALFAMEMECLISLSILP